MSYLVTAPLVLARDKEGKVHERYEGAVIDWLSDEQAEHLVGTNLVKEVESTDDQADGPADGEKPAASASNKVLAQWLVDNAVKEDGSDYTDAELKPLNKAQLRELIDAVE